MRKNAKLAASDSKCLPQINGNRIANSPISKLIFRSRQAAIKGEFVIFRPTVLDGLLKRSVIDEA